MSDRDHARALLAMAQKDLRALHGMLDVDTFAAEIFGFHAQQAAEKALKAWLALLGVPYPLTHDLGLLIALLDDVEEPTQRFEGLRVLNAFAVAYRYEALPPEGFELDRRATIGEVERLVRHVEQTLSTDDPS